MTSQEADVVRRKLAVIQRSLLELERVRALTLAEYITDLWRRKAIERFLQEAIEAAVDCVAHLLSRAGRPAPADLYSSFGAAAELGVLSGELAQQLAPATGLRNRLVHEYDTIDDARVLAAVPLAIDQLSRFIAAVETWLARETR